MKTFSPIEKVGLAIAVTGFLANLLWEFVPFEGDELTWWLVWAALGALGFVGLAIALGRPYNLDAALKRRYEISTAIISEWKPKK